MKKYEYPLYTKNARNQLIHKIASITKLPKHSLMDPEANTDLEVLVKPEALVDLTGHRLMFVPVEITQPFNLAELWSFAKLEKTGWVASYNEYQKGEHNIILALVMSFMTGSPVFVFYPTGEGYIGIGGVFIRENRNEGWVFEPLVNYLTPYLPVND